MVIINFILFQIAWFACVLGAANAMPWLGVAVTAFSLIWHLYQAKQAKPEALLMLIALIIGASFDQVMLSSNLIEYAHHGWNASIVPVWILALWLGFVTALNVSLRWMHGRKLVAILFGAIGGPLAYWSASKFGAVSLLSMNSYIALSIGWAVITLVLLRLSARLDGYKVNTLEADKSAQPNIGELT